MYKLILIADGINMLEHDIKSTNVLYSVMNNFENMRLL